MLSNKLILKKILEPFLLPEIEIIVDDGLGFTVKVFGCMLPEDHCLYKVYRRTMANVTIVTLIRELEIYKLCNGVHTTQLTDNLFHHVIPVSDTQDDDDEKISVQFPNKDYWRAK